MRRLTLIAWVGLLTVLITPLAVSAELTETQRRQIAQLDADMARAGALYVQEEFEKSGELVREVQAAVEQLAKDVGDLPWATASGSQNLNLARIARMRCGEGQHVGAG